MTNYMICSTVRSGSTLLCKTLERSGGFGHPEEYFHRHRLKTLNLEVSADVFLDYCHKILTQNSPEHFGLKMHWWQLMDFLALARQFPQFKEKGDVEILNAIFPDLKFIYLQRRHVVSQAVSAAIASQTGQWEKSHAPARPLKFQPWKIYEWEQSLVAQNQQWQAFFQDNHLDYYPLTYETLVASFSEEMSNVMAYLNPDLSSAHNQSTMPVSMPTQRQSNLTNQRFVRYYQRMPQPLSHLLYRLYRQLKPAPYGEAS